MSQSSEDVPLAMRKERGAAAVDSAAPAPQLAAGVKGEEAPAQQERQQQAASPAAALAAKPTAVAAAADGGGSDSDDDAPLLARKAAVKQGERADRVRYGPAVMQGPKASHAAAHPQCCAAAHTRRPCAPPTQVSSPPARPPCARRACVEQQARTQGQGSSGEEGGQLGPLAGAAPPRRTSVGTPPCLLRLAPAGPATCPSAASPPVAAQEPATGEKAAAKKKPAAKEEKPAAKNAAAKPAAKAASSSAAEAKVRGSQQGLLVCELVLWGWTSCPRDACDALPWLPARSQLAVLRCQLAVPTGFVVSPCPQRINRRLALPPCCAAQEEV